jgi:protein-S-isoprenylcysteine O-methyltransferase Ste14
VFSSLMVLGLLIIIGKPYLFLWLIFLLGLQTIRAHKEGKVLEAKFGEQYREYRKQTWF